VSRDSSISNVDQEALSEFLESKGAVELLIVLSEGDVPYSEFEDEVPVAKSTFHIRREQAVELQLIDSGRRQTEDGFENVYRLTSLGEVLVQKIKESGLIKLFWRLQEIQEQYDDAREEIPEWVSESEIDFDELHYRHFRHMDEWEPDEDFYR